MNDEYQKQWAVNNPDRIKAAKKRYRDTHKSILREKDAERRKNNPNKSKEYYLQNNELVKNKQREYRDKNRETLNRKARERRQTPENQLKHKQKELRKYGLTFDDYKGMWIEQNGCCGICKRYQTDFQRALAVDHCHDTGKVRGLLCDNCNTALGSFKDDITLLQSAINYLNPFLTPKHSNN